MTNDYIYLDSASTTKIDMEVIDYMSEYMRNNYGNPSSLHSLGNKAKVDIEDARRKIASLLNVENNEIIFTSGGTESNNTILNNLDSTDIDTIITTRLEHKSVLEPIQNLNKKGLKVIYLNTNQEGLYNLNELEDALKANKKVLICLMHANNEIGNLGPAEEIGCLAQRYGAWFHSDTIQTIGYLDVKPHTLGMTSCTGSAHKFYGPKGIGFLYLKEGLSLKPLVYGGAQELNKRGGTENVAMILGMALALERQLQTTNISHKHADLKKHLIHRIKNETDHINFNGTIDKDKSLNKIINLSITTDIEESMFLLALDSRGICVSAGSACTSRTAEASHVILALDPNKSDKVNIRVSLTKETNINHIDKLIDTLKKI